MVKDFLVLLISVSILIFASLFGLLVEIFMACLSIGSKIIYLLKNRFN